MRDVHDTRRNILTESANNMRLVLVPNVSNETPDIDIGADPPKELESHTFEVWRPRDSASGQEDVCVGHVIMQLLLTGLPNYKGDHELKSQPAGWFEQNYLPYRRPASLSTWSSPRCQFPLNVKRLRT